MEMCLFRAIIFPVLLKKPEMWIDHGIVIKTNINMIFKTAKVCKIINYFILNVFRYISSFVFLYFQIIRHHPCISEKMWCGEKFISSPVMAKQFQKYFTQNKVRIILWKRKLYPANFLNIKCMRCCQ